MTNQTRALNHKIRTTLLVAALITVASAFAYERLFVVPKWSSAWNQIKALDDDPLSGAITNVDIREMIGKEPANIDDSRSDFVVETYSWRRGFLVDTYDIHVILAKSSTSDKQFYYSASAGQRPTDANFPKSKPLVVNLNPPPIELGR